MDHEQTLHPHAPAGPEDFHQRHGASASGPWGTCQDEEALCPNSRFPMRIHHPPDTGMCPHDTKAPPEILEGKITVNHRRTKTCQVSAFGADLSHEGTMPITAFQIPAGQVAVYPRAPPHVFFQRW